jgi:hypothetical protein
VGVVERFKALVRTLGNIHLQGDKPNILLLATPRGGSTWMMEIIASQAGMKYFDEPFNIRRRDVIAAGRVVSWADLMPEADNKDRLIQYLKDLSANRIGGMNPPPFRKHHRFFTNRVVFKIHELEHMASTLEQELGAQVLYLLRHPIATAMSRNVLPRLELFMNSPYYREAYLDEAGLKAISRVYDHGTNIERGVLAWCFENVDALRCEDVKDWVFITYEELLLNSVKACRYLADRLALDDVGAMLRSVGEPSVNINLSGEDTHRILKEADERDKKRKLVTKWKSKVDDEGERAAMDLLPLFGLDAYSAGRFIANRRFLLFEDTTDPEYVGA